MLFICIYCIHKQRSTYCAQNVCMSDVLHLVLPKHWKKQTKKVLQSKYIYLFQMPRPTNLKTKIMGLESLEYKWKTIYLNVYVLFWIEKPYLNVLCPPLRLKKNLRLRIAKMHFFLTEFHPIINILQGIKFPSVQFKIISGIYGEFSHSVDVFPNIYFLS